MRHFDGYRMSVKKQAESESFQKKSVFGIRNARRAEVRIKSKESFTHHPIRIVPG
jgi:hypothetical protein